jgi:methylated-DNA-[protein]-cysteine S-methyltransferase
MKNERVYDALQDSPVGLLGIRMTADRLAGIDFLAVSDEADAARKSCRNQEPPAQVSVAIDRYFSSANSLTNIKIDLQGTDFQKKVWSVLQQIPAGSTRTYGEIARQLGSSARAVGNACRSNPVPIFVPCHRVVSASGAGGFMGASGGQPLAIKHWLLEHERKR